MANTGTQTHIPQLFMHCSCSCYAAVHCEDGCKAHLQVPEGDCVFQQAGPESLLSHERCTVDADACHIVLLELFHNTKHRQGQPGRMRRPLLQADKSPSKQALLMRHQACCAPALWQDREQGTSLGCVVYLHIGQKIQTIAICNTSTTL